MQSNTPSPANGRRRKVLITGGSGTVGTAFMQRYQDEFEFYNISRNETHINTLSQQIPDVTSLMTDVRDGDRLINLFLKIRPDIVIHAAALKHVNHAELNPSKTVEINIVGSLNVIRACIRADVPIAVAISTDKACHPENIYGYSKKITEQIFLEHYNASTKFVCARFANVAASNGSVIPFWVDSARKGLPLKLTDSRMNRLMFTEHEAAELIRQTISYAEVSTQGFVLSRIMKSVNMLELANMISQEHGDGSHPAVIGMRPGERLNEILVSQAELNSAYRTRDGQHIALHSDEFGHERLTQELSSLTADYMSDAEIRRLYPAAKDMDVSGNHEPAPAHSPVGAAHSTPTDDTRATATQTAGSSARHTPALTMAEQTLTPAPESTGSTAVTEGAGGR